MSTWAEEMTNLADAIGDELSVPITYRTVTPGALNLTTGKTADTTSDTTVNACRLRGRTDIAPSGKRVEQTRWLIPAASVAAPDSNDRIVYDGDTYRIVSTERSLDGTMWELTTERSLN